MRWTRQEADVVQLLHQVLFGQTTLLLRMEKLMVTAQELVDAVNAERATEDKLVALATAQNAQLKDLADQLAAAIASNDQQAMQAALDSIKQNQTAMDGFLAQVSGGGGNASVAGGGTSRQP